MKDNDHIEDDNDLLCTLLYIFVHMSVKNILVHFW